jgi:hypothetical protein
MQSRPDCFPVGTRPSVQSYVCTVLVLKEELLLDEENRRFCPRIQAYFPHSQHGTEALRTTRSVTLPMRA